MLFRNKLTIGIIAILLSYSLLLQGQDTRFNQFYTAPQYLNPAMTGIFEGSFRFNANFRDQWSSILGSNPFRSVHAGADFRFNSFGSDYFALGVNALVDRSGSGNFSNNQFSMSGSYLKQVGGSPYTTSANYLVAAGQFGFGQYTLNPNQLWFSDQYSAQSGLPDLGAPSNDPALSGGMLTTDLFLDYSAGLLWYGVFQDNLSAYLGGAIKHLSAPNVSLIGDVIQLPQRFVIHGGGEFPINTGLSVLPAFNFTKQGTRSSTTVGFNFRYTNYDWREVAIRAGIWPHFSKQLEQGLHVDEIAFAFILEMNAWNLGVSYGINSSSLNLATNARGAIEVSLIYVRPSKERVGKTKCPKF